YKYLFITHHSKQKRRDEIQITRRDTRLHSTTFYKGDAQSINTLLLSGKGQGLGGRRTIGGLPYFLSVTMVYTGRPWGSVPAGTFLPCTRKGALRSWRQLLQPAPMPMPEPSQMGKARPLKKATEATMPMATPPQTLSSESAKQRSIFSPS
ncbi:hypothetical protein PMAYCL1PPCAC_05145, partial [Pristionchus mayeri]